MCLKMCCTLFLTSSWSVKSTQFSSDFIFRNRNLSQRFKSGEQGLCLMIWTPESAKNPWVNLEACGLALSIWSSRSLNLILPPLWFINLFLVDLRYSIIFTESIEVPLGRTETEYLFGLQVKLTITIVFRSVSLGRCSWAHFCLSQSNSSGSFLRPT